MKSTEITAVTCSADRKTATIFGDATIDGAGSFKFRIRVSDNGEPGTSDVYGIIRHGPAGASMRPACSVPQKDVFSLVRGAKHLGAVGAARGRLVFRFSTG